MAKKPEEGMTSKNLIKWSLLFLHVVLAVLIFAVFNGKESDIIWKMFDATLNAILLNIAAVGTNKTAELFLAWKYGGKSNATVPAQ